MNKEDFNFEAGYFPELLDLRSTGLEQLKNWLWLLLREWPAVAESTLASQASILIDETAQQVQGKVLGKPFILDFSFRACDTVSIIEVVLALPGVSTNSLCEISRFLIAPSGEVLSLENETLLETQDEGDDEHIRVSLLYAILRKVMSHPVPF
nr:hypothetical protein [uncultured Pseudomonas sp.]